MIDAKSPDSGKNGPRASFIAGSVASGFTEKQAEWLWTAIPFHPLVEEWKDSQHEKIVHEYAGSIACP